MSNHPELASLDISLTDTETRRLALLDMQSRHAAELASTGILAQAITSVEIPVTRDLHVCVFRQTHGTGNGYHELGGVRLKDNQTPRNTGIYVPVYKVLGIAQPEAGGRFTPEDASTVARMVAELVLMNDLDGLQLRPDLCELAVVMPALEQGQ